MRRDHGEASRFGHHVILSFTDISRANCRCVPWIESPLTQDINGHIRLYRHSDATPAELFFDLFFVANLTTYTSIHKINSVEALWSYVAFLGIIWFTWLEITFYDVRLARDSIFERTCKALQMAIMLGFAAAGSKFSTHIVDDNAWVFRALGFLLGFSRLLLCVQYGICSGLVSSRLKQALPVLVQTCLLYAVTSIIYMGTCFAFKDGSRGQKDSVWLVWFVLFAIEALVIMIISRPSSGVGFEGTHINVRMKLLTLIIIGEGIVSIAKIIHQTVGPGGWTRYSCLHILGVTTMVYLLWQSYFDLSPMKKFGRFRQLCWVSFHYPFHVLLVLLSEGWEILALTLDIAVKVQNLSDTISYVCEPVRSHYKDAVALINSTIVDMKISFSRDAVEEESNINSMLWNLTQGWPLCDSSTRADSLSLDMAHYLMGNVTAALFHSMGIALPNGYWHGRGISPSSQEPQSLMPYVKLLSFVYVYYFVAAAGIMFFLVLFACLARLRESELGSSPATTAAGRLNTRVLIGIRILLGVVLVTLVALLANWKSIYHFMANPMILFTFTLTLLIGLLVDRILDSLTARGYGVGGLNSYRYDTEKQSSPTNSSDSSDTGAMVELSPHPISPSETQEELKSEKLRREGKDSPGRLLSDICPGPGSSRVGLQNEEEYVREKLAKQPELESIPEMSPEPRGQR